MSSLHFATSWENAWNAIKLHGEDVNGRNKDGQTPLHVCRYVRIAEVLVENGADVNARDNDGQTPLHYYVNPSKCNLREKVYEAIKLLVDHGANVNARDNDGKTPLELLDHCFNAEMGECLLNVGADVSARNDGGQTALHVCKDLSFAKFLIAHGADVNARDNHGQTPLHVCSDPKKAEILINNGADVQERDNDGQTPLQTCEATQVVSVLMKHGAKLNAQGSSTPVDKSEDDLKAEMLRIYADCKNVDLSAPERRLFGATTAQAVLACIADGEDVNERDEKEQTPLHRCRNAEVAKALLENGADVDALDIFGQTPLFVTRNLEKARVLLEHGANPNVKVKMCDILLRKVVEQMDEDGCLDEEAEELVDLQDLDDGYEWDDDELEPLRLKYRHLYIWKLKNEIYKKWRASVDDFYLTPLLEGNVSIVDSEAESDEVEYGYNLHPRYHRGSYYYISSPYDSFDDGDCLELGVCFANEKYLRLLVEHGADITTTDYFGRTMFHYCQNAEFAEYLFERCEAAGLNPKLVVNISDRFGVSALHFASSGKNVELVKSLIRHGALVNDLDDVELTPLHRCNDVEVARVLVENGADVNAVVNPMNLVLDEEQFVNDDDFPEKMQVIDYIDHEYQRYNNYTIARRERKSEAFVEFIEGCEGFVPLKSEDDEDDEDDDEDDEN